MKGESYPHERSSRPIGKLVLPEKLTPRDAIQGLSNKCQNLQWNLSIITNIDPVSSIVLPLWKVMKNPIDNTIAKMLLYEQRSLIINDFCEKSTNFENFKKKKN